MTNKSNLINVAKLLVSIILVASLTLLLSANYLLAQSNILKSKSVQFENEHKDSNSAKSGLESKLIKIENDAESVKFTSDSVYLNIPYGETSEKLKIQLENTTGKLLMVELFVIEDLKYEDVKKDSANLSLFIDNNSIKETIEKEIKDKEKLSFDIEVDKVDKLETYTGKVRANIYYNDCNNLLISNNELTIKATKSELFFTPKLKIVDKESFELKEVKSLEFQYSKKYKDLCFYLENPKEDGIRQEFVFPKVLTLKKEGGGGEILVPLKSDTEKLEAGEVTRILFCDSNNTPFDFDSLECGSYTGMLKITSSNNKLSNEPIPVKFTKSYSNSFNFVLVWIILSVGSGAILALIIDTILPIMTDKLNNKKKLNDINKKISCFAKNDNEIHTKLAVMKKKADILNDRISFFKRDVASRKKEFDERLTQLNEYLKIAKDIKDLRDKKVNDVNEEHIPKTLESKVLKILNNAEQNLIDEKTDKAKEKVKEAEKYFETEVLDNEALKNFRTKLAQNIKALKEKYEELNFNSEEDFIKKLYNGLQNDISDNDEKKLIQIDREYRIVDLYLNKYKSLDCSKQDPKNQAELICLLKDALSSNMSDITFADKAYEEAELLIDSLLTGITLKNFTDTLKNDLEQKKDETIDCSKNSKDVRINLVNNNLYYDDIVRFKFDYLNSLARVNDSRLAKSFTYIWDFGDETSKTSGKETVHFYNYKSHKKTKEFTVTVEVENSDGILLGSIEKKVLVKRPKKRYKTDPLFLEITCFTIMLFLAVGFASFLQIDKTQSFLTVKDYITPFLLGLSFEQSKDMFKNTILKLSPPT